MDKHDNRDYDDYEQRHHRSFFFPILLIAVGLIYLLSNMGYIEGSGMDFILRLWPLIFIIGGLDDLLRGQSISGPVLGIGIGSLLLLANFGYFQWSVWEVLFRFWPVFLIAWGLDLIIGRRTAVQKILGVLVALALVAGMFWMVGLQPDFTTAANITTITQNIENAKSAEITIERPVGSVNLAGGTESGRLLSGAIPLETFERVSTNYKISGGKAVYELSSRGEAKGPIVIGPGQHGWRLAMTDAVPVDLSVNTAVGETRLDLSKTRVENLDVKMAVGSIDVRMPREQALEGAVRAAVGGIILYVPKGAHARIDAKTVITAVSFPPDFHRENDLITNAGAETSAVDIDLKIDLPVGFVSVRYLP